ncbi:MAG: SlyX family protein [Rhodoferax sp.]|jgi:SlyX protein|nr:SlyX family protein [Rhodoferax sp.]
MSDHDSINKRLTDLEVKASFAEDLVDQLEQIIVRQQRQIDMLIGQVAESRAPQAGGDGVGRNLRDELPPHY